MGTELMQNIKEEEFIHKMSEIECVVNPTFCSVICFKLYQKNTIKHQNSQSYVIFC